MNAGFLSFARSLAEKRTLAVTVEVMMVVAIVSCHGHYLLEDMDIYNEAEGGIPQGPVLLRPTTFCYIQLATAPTPV